MPFFSYKPIKAPIRGVFSSHTVALETYYVTKMITCLPVIGQCFDTMIVALGDKKWLLLYKSQWYSKW